MGAHYFSSNRFVGLPVLAALLIFSRFTTWRLPKSIVITYGLRALLLIVLLTMMNRTDTQDTTPWYLKQEDTNLAGYALAADIVLRSWEKRDASAAREGLGVVVLMTALLFAAATDTYERLHIQITTPIYALFLLLSLRSFGLMQQPPSPARTLRSGLILLRTSTLLLTLAVAALGVWGVTRYEYQVENWAMQFVHQHRDPQHEIGFSASPRLATIFNPEESLDRVFVIDGTLRDSHLRVAAFHLYQSQQWFPLPQDGTYTPLPQTDAPPASQKNVLKFTRFADTEDLLALPLAQDGVFSKDALEEESSGTIRDTNKGSFAPYLVLNSRSISPQKLGFTALDEKSQHQLLAEPVELDPRVIALSKTVAGTGDPARQIFRIVKYLQSHHTYALKYEPQGEPLNDFILNDRSAHCQYFASAVVVMARAVGIPARYVGGFYAHEPYGDAQTVVRQRDAHAWAECWLDKTGWVTVDATPPGHRPDAAPNPPAWRRWWEKLNDLPGQIREWITSNAPLLKHLALLAAVAVLFLWIARRLLRWRKRPAVAPSRYLLPSAQLIEISRRYDAWLTRRGLACPPESTWRAQLKSAKAPDWPSADETELCEQFVQTYDRARFGGDETEAIARAKGLLETIEHRP
jgi:transglutaminase-like putative cysteine protease